MGSVIPKRFETLAACADGKGYGQNVKPMELSKADHPATITRNIYFGYFADVRLSEKVMRIMGIFRMPSSSLERHALR